MASVTRLVSDSLRLTVNPLKSAVDLSRLGVSVVETQLSNHKCITFYSIRHAMLIFGGSLSSATVQTVGRQERRGSSTEERIGGDRVGFGL